MKPFYITTTLPYVNSDPHFGFAVEIIRADIIARWKRELGHEVFFNTGTDEHGIKIYRKATEEGIDPQTYVDGFSKQFRVLRELLDLSWNNFVRTTDPHHIAAAEKFWTIVNERGYIYKKFYSIKYCVGCELEKTDSELVDGKCPIHPTYELELINEENYFFKASAFQAQLLDLYKRPLVLPDSRLGEVRAFVERGVEDFSISRLASKMPWGVPVPNDPAQVMYVWFDALVSYLSAIGWPENTTSFEKWWPAVQYCGKDNLRQQSAMWQSMLAAAGLPFSEKIIINGFIVSDGKKMSKSIGNVISPADVVAEFGVDTVRYYVARRVSPFEDSDVTMDKIRDAFNADLANGLGNLVSRTIKMAATYGVTVSHEHWAEVEANLKASSAYAEYAGHLDSYNIQLASDVIWNDITKLDVFIQEKKPFIKVKTDPEGAKADLVYVLDALWGIAVYLRPIMPSTSEKIAESLRTMSLAVGLFPRKEVKK